LLGGGKSALARKDKEKRRSSFPNKKGRVTKAGEAHPKDEREKIVFEEGEEEKLAEAGKLKLTRRTKKRRRLECKINWIYLSQKGRSEGKKEMRRLG